MPGATKLVQNDTGNTDTRIECLVAQDKRCNAARHAARVQHQHHGQIQQLRKRSVAVAAVQRQPIVQTFVAFHDADVCPSGMANKAACNLLGRHQEGVKIETLASTGLAQPHGINVIGPFLERLHDQTLRRQCGAESDRDRGLAGRFVCRRNQKARHAKAVSGADGCLRSAAGLHNCIVQALGQKAQ